MCSSCSARGDGLSLQDKRASRELKLVLFWYAMTHEVMTTSRKGTVKHSSATHSWVLDLATRDFLVADRINPNNGSPSMDGDSGV
ncbi:hypothetical protein TNCT_677921 [Trichonephila clavata]|uniref:Uncharacterized protein n=1 Tax=Trichonephila clavata TaxID=2740835 RepID=A0A8X6IGA0_TRICU|nr:hypothetical protein TNCT_677921 [Trichonephila clavata]